MNEEPKEWSRRYNLSIGMKEIIRLGCAIIIWIFIGVVISLALELAGYSLSSIVFGIFFVSPFVFAFIAASRKSTYSLLRKILGNENLPHEPFPRSTVKIPHRPLPWWAHLPGIWGWLMGLALLYAVIRYLSK